MNRHERRYQDKLRRKIATETPLMEFVYNPNVLQGIGPVIETDVGITDAHRTLLENANIAIPNPVRCRLLIDTGATKSLVRHETAIQGGLKLINANTPIHGVGVDTSGRTYLGRIWFRCPSRVQAGGLHNIAIDAQINSGDLGDSPIDGLIGRDVLRHFELRYHGPDGKLSLKFLGTK